MSSIEQGNCRNKSRISKEKRSAKPKSTSPNGNLAGFDREKFPVIILLDDNSSPRNCICYTYGSYTSTGFTPPPLFAVDEIVEKDGMTRARLGIKYYGYVSVFEYASHAEGPHADVYSEHRSVRLNSPDSDQPLTAITLNREGQSVTASVEGGGSVTITYSPRRLEALG